MSVTKTTSLVRGVESTYDTNSLAVQGLKKIFRLEKKDGNDIFLRLFIYLSDTSKIQEVNRYLRVRHSDHYSQALDIWYFDKKNFAVKYLKAVDNHGLSDEAFAALDKHMICQYSWAGSGDGSFDYNTK